MHDFISNIQPVIHWMGRDHDMFKSWLLLLAMGTCKVLEGLMVLFKKVGFMGNKMNSFSENTQYDNYPVHLQNHILSV